MGYTKQNEKLNKIINDREENGDKSKYNDNYIMKKIYKLKHKNFIVTGHDVFYENGKFFINDYDNFNDDNKYIKRWRDYIKIIESF